MSIWGTTINKAVHISLMLCLSVSGLLYIAFNIAQFKSILNAKAFLSENTSLQQLRVPISELKNGVAEQEIWVDGKMYDISSCVIEGDYAVITAYHDEQEESLVKNLIDSIDTEQSYTTDTSTHLLKHKIRFPNDYKILVDPIVFEYVSIPNSLIPPSTQDGNIILFARNVITPPPRV